MSNLAKVIDDLRIESDNYIRTVQALKAMANELLWDDVSRKLTPNGNAYFGMRLATSPKNRISPNNNVTPDLVVSVPRKYNVLVEAKLALSADAVKRQAKLLDLQKYDDDLIGLSTPSGKSRNHDIILLVAFTHAINVKDDLNRLQTEKMLSFERNFALVRFMRMEEDKMWFVLELVLGCLKDKNKTDKLQRPLAIEMEHLVSNPRFGHIKLYDAEPPLPLLMQQIHELVFNSLTRKERLALRERTQVDITLSISKVRQQLAETCGPGITQVERIPDIPKSQWIRRALQAFIKLGWAEKHKQKRNTFIYHVKKRREPLGQFNKFCAKQRFKKEEEREKQRAREMEKHPLFKDLIQREHQKN